MASIGEVAILLTLLGAPPGTGAPPGLQARIKTLEAELAEAKREIQRLTAPVTHYVECERSDLLRDSPSLSANDRGEVERVLARLSTLGVDPVYERDAIGQPGARPVAYAVRAGCAFLGGDRITEVDGVPVGDTSRVRAILLSRDRWRFTVGARPELSGRPTAQPAPGRFDLGAALGLNRAEAVVVPYLSEGQQRGFMVWSVEPGGYFSQAGLRPRDVLLEVNGLVLQHQDAEKVIGREWRERGQLEVKVERDGKPLVLTPIADQGRLRR